MDERDALAAKQHPPSSPQAHRPSGFTPQLFHGSPGQSFTEMTSPKSQPGSGPASPRVNPKANPRESALSAKIAKINLEPRRSLDDSKVVANVNMKRVTTAEMVHTFDDQLGCLRALAVSPDSNTLYSGGEGKTIREWSVGAAGFSLRHAVNDAHSGWVWTLLASQDGQILYSGSGDCMIHMWAVGQGMPPRLVHVLKGHQEGVCSLAASKDGAFLYSGSDDRTIRVWDVSAGLSAPPQLLQVLTGHAGYISAMALSQDGLTLFSAGMAGDHSIKMWRACGLRPSEEASPCQAPASPREATGTSPSCNSAVPYKAPTCRLLATLSGHTLGVYTIALSPDERLLYSGGEDKNILVWSVDGAAGTGQLLRILEGAHDRWVRSMRLTADGRTLISGSADSTIALWDMAAERGTLLLQVLRKHTDRVRCIRISPDGRYFYSASSDRTIRCWLLK